MGRTSPLASIALVLPFALALLTAGAMLDSALGPAVDELQLEQAPPPPAQSSPVHHDDSALDPTELVNV